MIKVKGYIRVSSKTQEDNSSLESQREAIVNYCKALNYELVEIVEEVGSGSNTTKRPKFSQLVDSIIHGEAQGIVTTKLDRFARSLKDLINIVDSLHVKGRFLICFNDNINTKDANSQLLMGILGSVAQWERARINQRISEGKETRLKQTGSRAVLGGAESKLNKKRITQEEANSWVRAKKKGFTYEEIAKRFNRHKNTVFRYVSKELSKI